MRKKIAVLLCGLLVVSSICACGGDNTTNEAINDTISDTETETITKSNKLIDKDVEVILMCLDDECETVEEYVEKMSVEEPDTTYAVYDGLYYSVTMKDSEREAILNELTGGNPQQFFLEGLQEDEMFNNAFVSIEADDLLYNIKLYADASLFDGMELGAPINIVFYAMVYSESIQAYNLIIPEDRSCELVIYDNETNEILYEWESAEELME